jgi:prepilin-type N-terminal cleavage/methylation domain-containing protein
MRSGGYTLIEVAIVIVIMGILVAFLAPILLGAVNAYDTASRNIEVLTKMRYSMDRMAREIRNLRRDPTNTGRGDISSMTATKFEFCRGDGTRVTLDAAAVAGEVRIGYTAGGLQTSCPVGAATTNTLTDAVTAFQLQYCRIDSVCAASSGATVDELSVAFVDITMTLTGAGTGAYTSGLRVDLRNP